MRSCAWSNWRSRKELTKNCFSWLKNSPLWEFCFICFKINQGRILRELRNDRCLKRASSQASLSCMRTYCQQLTVNLRFRYEFSSTFTGISCRGAVSLEFHFSGGFPLWENLKICNLLQSGKISSSALSSTSFTGRRNYLKVFFPVLCWFL